METSRRFLDELFFERWAFTAEAVLLLWSVLLLIAWMSHSRVLRFAWLFVMLSPAPIAFIRSRGAPQYYVPSFGWALYAAAALLGVTAWLGKRFPARTRDAVIFLGALLLLYPYYKAKGWSNVVSVTIESKIMRALTEELHSLHPRLRTGARLFFFHDPVHADWDNMRCIAQLSYRDRTIAVGRQKTMQQRPGDDDLGSYDYVFDYKAGHVVEMSQPWLPKMMPMIFLTADGSAVYHTDFKLVSEGQPARPGEWLIARAVDLGPTSPEVPPGRPFPGDPLAKVTSTVDVSVNGVRTEVRNQLGWPGEIDAYRVDFRVPPGTRAGVATVQVAVGEAGGLPARIFVR